MARNQKDKVVECLSCGKWLNLRALRTHCNTKHFEEIGIGTPLRELWIERRSGEFRLQKIDCLTDTNHDCQTGPYVTARFFSEQWCRYTKMSRR